MNPFSLQGLSSVLALALALAPVLLGSPFAACGRRDDAREGREPSSPPRSPPAQALLGPEALEAGGEPVDPPAPAGNLAAELEQFTTIEKCVESRARLDPLVGDAIEAIGYDTFLVDACRVLDAAKARDGRRCDAIEASMLRTRCRATVAELAGEADDCPWQFPARPARGRDPACVAIAARDPRLCAGALDTLSRAACAAVTGHDAGACAGLPLRAEKARCARQVERWGAVVQSVAPVGNAKPLAPASGKLRVDAADAGTPLEQDLTSELEDGVVLVEERDGARLVIGSLPELGPGLIAASPHARASLGLALFVPGGARDARVERVELVLPGRLALATPGAHASLVVKISALERARAGAVAFTVEGELGDAVSTCRIHVDASTFVRDVVRASAFRGVPPQPVGTGGGMR